MNEQCKYCQNAYICTRREATMKLREKLKEIEREWESEGVSGRIHFDCYYFREKNRDWI